MNSSLIWLIGGLLVAAAVVVTQTDILDSLRGVDPVPAIGTPPGGADQSGEAPSLATVGPDATGEGDVGTGTEVADTDQGDPELDLVRVKPTGDTLVTGRSDPNAIVALMNNGRVVGKTVANEQGDWVVVLEEPLEPGEHDISADTQAEDGTSTGTSKQRATVLINEDKTSEPLVLLTEPDAPSSIVSLPNAAQVPNEPAPPPDAEPEQAADEAPTETLVAAAEDPEPAVPASADAEVADADQLLRTPSVDTPTESLEPSAKPVGSAEQLAADAFGPRQDVDEAIPSPQTLPENVTREVETASDTTHETAAEERSPAADLTRREPRTVSADQTIPAASDSDAEAGQGTMAAATVDPGRIAAASNGDEALAGAETGTEQAIQEQTAAPRVASRLAGVDEQPADRSAPAEPFVRISSMSLLAGKLLLAGETEPGTTIRLRLDGSNIATLIADEAGRFRYAGTDELPVGDHTVEAAVIRGGLALATVRNTITRRQNPLVTIKTVEVEGNRVYVAGETLPSGIVRVYVNDQFAGEARAGREGRWVLEARISLAPGLHQVRADQVSGDGSKVLARAAVPFERIRDDPVLVPMLVAGDASAGGAEGDATAGLVAAPKRIIIRQGDNLWSISRRLYGRGIRFTTIYQANAQEIQDPDLIFPGQVFVLPESDQRWDDDPVTEWNNIRG